MAVGAIKIAWLVAPSVVVSRLMVPFCELKNAVLQLNWEPVTEMLLSALTVNAPAALTSELF